MSLLQRNEMTITLSPQQVNISLRRSSWRGIRMQQLTLPCTPASPELWTAPLAVLDSVLKREQWSAAHVTVILSNHFVRYMLIPWSEMLLRSNEQQAYLRHLFSETYGDIASRYQLRLSPAAPGMERIASAIDNALLEQLRTTVADAGLRLDSIQPWLMHSFNKHRHEPRREGGWFISVEPGVIGIIGMADNQWQLVRTLRCSLHWQHELSTALERLYLSGDADKIPKILHWCSTDMHQAAPVFNGLWQVIQLGANRNGLENAHAPQLATAS